MTREQIKTRQKKERAEKLQAILDSDAKKKLIVAGPGTGKTFTFGKLLESRTGGNNLAMTFIKKLVADMEATLAEKAEVKTFHAYCKKILHDQSGSFELVPYLTKVIKKDAALLHKSLDDFEAKFRTMKEDSPDIAFYLKRGDYYEVVGFDDSVYRLYKEIQTNPAILPVFEQIMIDEFQDFNPLEVAFIEELAKKGSILIVGDDDQAIYDDRSASPTYLRHIYASKDFEKFELPFCIRCPEAVVTATNNIIKTAAELGHFKGRIPKRFECYLEDKESDSQKYPHIILAKCTLARVIPKYLKREIAGLDPKDIAQSNEKGKEYPSVLIVGTKQYLREVEKYLRAFYPQLSYVPSQPIGYGIVEAYECLLRNAESNLGWRILMELYSGTATQEKILRASEDGTPMVDLISNRFIMKHTRAVKLIRTIQDGTQPVEGVKAKIVKILGEHAAAAITHFTPKEEDLAPAVDKTKPTILLTSFKGCKGLSAGHVFIVGVHNKSMPRDASDIRDVEISQFIVALTRTRKQCHIISNNWLVAPVDGTGTYIPPFEASPFIAWIPKTLVKDRGKLSAKDFK